MSLDTVELVMRIEERFGIVIPDLDAEKIGTVGQAYDYILDRVDLSTTAPCRSASSFYRLRRALMAQSGADRRSIRPTSPIVDFLPETGRRAAWLALGARPGVVLPALELSSEEARSAVNVGLASVLLTTGPILGWIMPAIGFGYAAFLIGLSFVLGWIAAHLVLAPLASTIPPGCETIRSLVLATLGRSSRPLENVSQMWHPAEVWDTLRSLIAEQTGLSPEQISAEQHFLYDLGM